MVAVRSSGPGGQNVNKVNSRIQLRWNIEASQALPQPVKARFLQAQRRRISNEGIFQLSSQRFRDQEKNRVDCLDRLKDFIQQATIKPKIRRKTKPSRRSIENRLKEKRLNSEKKQSRRSPNVD